VHSVTFKNPSQALQERLRETGPLPTDEEAARSKKKNMTAGLGNKKNSQKFDYEKIAEALEKLEEEDLLRVIQMINENKGPDTYIRSDVEGELCPCCCYASLHPRSERFCHRSACGWLLGYSSTPAWSCCRRLLCFLLICGCG
jgi:hypothetical protein